MTRKYAYVALATSFALIASVTFVRAADFDVRIVNLDGSPIVDDKGKEVELTVRSVSINALMAPYQDETNLAAEEKLKRAELAQKISKKETSDLKSEDIALIKKLVNKFYNSPLVVKQAYDALEKK